MLFGGRLPKQLRRALPIYVACILFVLFFSKANTFQPSVNATDVLKRVLAYQVPLQETNTIFPKKIWQTWKMDPLDFEERDSVRARSWTSMNPGYRYEVLTDGNDLHYVETHFGPGPGGIGRPDIVDMYRSLTATIIKADLLRYLMMYIEGGTYADIDVEALKPVDQFIPPHIDEGEIDLVISVEIDEPTYGNHSILGPKSQSFCQWTFMSKPRVPVLLKLVDHILAWLGETAEKQNVPIGEIVLNFDDVLTGTGPSAFTGAILLEMSKQTNQLVTWDYFHGLTEARKVGNILVLEVQSFAAGQGHSNAGTHDSEKALVKHHYHASLWPSRHPRYSHPAYGMVEECNWNPECVGAWDADTAAFPSLPSEEQARLIALHEQQLAEKFDQEEAEKAAAEKEVADTKAAELREAYAQQANGGIPGLAAAPPAEVQDGGEQLQGPQRGFLAEVAIENKTESAEIDISAQTKETDPAAAQTQAADVDTHPDPKMKTRALENPGKRTDSLEGASWI